MGFLDWDCSRHDWVWIPRLARAASAWCLISSGPMRVEGGFLPLRLDWMRAMAGGEVRGFVGRCHPAKRR